MLNRHHLSLNYSDLQEMLAELQQAAERPETGINYQVKGNEILWRLHQPFGTMLNRSISLRKGLNLSVAEWDMTQDLSLTMSSQAQPSFGFSFCLSGGFLTKILGSTVDMETRTSEAQSGLFQGDIKAVSEVMSGQKVSLVQLDVNPDLLGELLEDSADDVQKSLDQIFSNSQAGFQWETRNITPTMAIALRQIIHCPYRGLTRRLYLEGKALELMALQLDSLGEKVPTLPSSSSLKPDDVARIYLARDILIRNLDTPPSLLALAKEAGINSLKLKKGFRQVFNTTVFGYLYTHRMEEGRRLLELGRLNVTQVAQVVGYTHPGKFAAAFKKKYGITPTAFKSSRSAS
ncbi:MAG: AraC family transcriptional regulator [Cyanobacteria bacterium P01_C01_bin.89]